MQFATSRAEMEVLERLDLVALSRSPSASVNLADQIYAGNVGDGVPARKFPFSLGLIFSLPV